MAFSNETRPGLRVTEGVWSQRVIYVAAILAWAIFIQSALNQDFRPWFNWLVAGRVIMALAAVSLLASTFLSRRSKDFTSVYFLFCAALQSTYACLEPSNQIEFYKFVSYLFFLSCVTFVGSLKHWLQFRLVPSILVLAVPLFFKSADMFAGVGAFAYSFTETVSIVFISAIVLKLTTSKYSVLVNNLQLKDQLLDAEINAHANAQKQLEGLKTELVEFAKYQAIAKCLQMVSHDVRKPLALVRIAMDLFSSAKDLEQFQSYKKDVSGEIETATHQIEGLLQDLMNAGNDNIQVYAEKVDALAFIETQVKRSLLGNGFSKERIKISVSDGLKIKIDEGKFSRVLANLVNNAVQAPKAASDKIYISAFEEEGRNIILVENTGAWLPEEGLGRLFDAFFTKGKKNGTGLGLAIVKSITEAHKGTVSCISEKDSSHPNGFVEFRVSLPI